MLRHLLYPFLLLLVATVADGAAWAVPASSAKSLLADEVTLPGFSAGYHELGYAVFDVRPGHYGTALFQLSLGAARAVTPGPPPISSATIFLEEVPSPQVRSSFTFFDADWSGPFIGQVQVTASPSPQSVTAELLSQQLVGELDRGGEVAIAGLSLLGPDQPNPLEWTGAGSASLFLREGQANAVFIPEPGCVVPVVLAVLALARPRIRA